MSDTAEGNSRQVLRRPKPLVKKSRWPYPLIWIVPVLAAVGAGFYFRDRLHDRGTTVTITFDDGNGLKAGQTPVSHLGIEVGRVTDVRLSADQQHAVVEVRLRCSAEAFAKMGTAFWVVRPRSLPRTSAGSARSPAGRMSRRTPARANHRPSSPAWRSCPFRRATD